MRMIRQRTLRADGEKIKQLRAATGKTQKELLRGSHVQMRSYQRAEQGLGVSPAILQEIAALFKRPLGDVCKSEAPKYDDYRGSTFRLHPCDGKGGRTIVHNLQCGIDIRFTFDVDPYGSTASLIADVVRFCKLNRYTQDADLLEDDDFIEAVGELNSKIAELYVLGVNIHYAVFLRWETNRDTLGQDQLVRLPTCKHCLEIVFSERSGVIHKPMHFWETYEQVCRSCHRSNFGHRVTPEQLSDYLCEIDGSMADRDFLANYAAYIRKETLGGKSGPEEPLLLTENAEAN